MIEVIYYAVNTNKLKVCIHIWNQTMWASRFDHFLDTHMCTALQKWNL